MADCGSEAGSTVAVVDHGDGACEGEARVDRISSVDQSRENGPAEREELRVRHIAWDDLLKRVLGVDALRCPNLGGRMPLIAAITEASVAQKILESLALPSRAPPLAPAAPSEPSDPEPDTIDRSFEETLVAGPSDPGWGFDQSADEAPIEDEGA